MKSIPATDTRFVRKGGKVTDKLRRDLSDVLLCYSEAAAFWADKRAKPREDYTIREAYIVGSTIRGIDNSDVDLLLIPDHIEGDDYRFFKLVLAQTFFVNRPKCLAVDVFVRPHDEYPERPSFEITGQVKDILDNYNQRLKEYPQHK